MIEGEVDIRHYLHSEMKRHSVMNGWVDGAGKRTNEEQEWKKRCTCLCERRGELKASTHEGSSL